MAQIKKVRWTLVALYDLDDARAYIAKERPSSAQDLIRHVERALEALIHYPLMGRAGRVPDTRELSIGHSPFLLAYRVRDNRLEILGFMHAARRWPDRF
jgi:toxin ParE1/3/4